MQAYSLDLRTRIVAAVDAKRGTQQEIAALFGVSHAYVKKLLYLRRTTGSITPKPHGGGQPPKLTPPQYDRVRTYIEQTRNDATVDEVQRFITKRLWVDVSRATAGRVLQRLGLSRKKNAGRHRTR